MHGELAPPIYAPIGAGAAAARAAGWGYHELATEHNAQVAEPEAVAFILIGSLKRPGGLGSRHGGLR